MPGGRRSRCCRRSIGWALLLTQVSGQGIAKIRPGRYFLLNRQTGQYLQGDEGLGKAGINDTALWSISENQALYEVQNVKTGQLLGSHSWYIHSTCRGSCVSFSDQGGKVLAPVPDETGALRVAPSAPHEAGSFAHWVYLSPCLGEDSLEVQQTECFPKGSHWGSMADDCCNSLRYGPRGNPSCWDGLFTFERCCASAAKARSALTAVEAPSGAPQLLCSGERLQGAERFVRQAGFDGERMWHPSRSFEAAFDFQDQDEGVLLRVASGLPDCGGPSLFEEARTILEQIEQHHVDVLRELHEALVEVSKRSASVHPVTYLPFFPFLLMALHQRTGKADYLHCIARTAASLAQLPRWAQNAGYDFLLPIGYDRPWERRGQQFSGLEADPYILQTYDTRFGNMLLLATHDVFFGDRHSLLTPNYGGGAYRNLRNIVVPLPFELNCSFWRSAVEERTRSDHTPRRFRVSFAGSQNGDTRALVHRAAASVSARLSSEMRSSLAVRFVVSDEERAELSRTPAAVLRRWFGDSVMSFDDLLRESDFCLVLPGDVSDLAMRFLHALSAGCTPVVVGGPATTVPLPFAQLMNYTSFARFARVRDVSEAETMLKTLLEAQERPLWPTSAAEREERLRSIAGLYTRHVDCGFDSGQPFRDLLAKSLEARAAIWQQLRWYN